MPEQQAKPWYASRTVWAGLITAIIGFFSLLGYTVSEDLKQLLIDQAVQIATAVATIITGVLAIYGRFKADKPVKLKRDS